MAMPRESLPPGATETGRIGEYRGWNDRLLRYRVVPAESPRGSLVYLHGIESHGGWFMPVAAELARQGCTTYLLDRRGSGLNRETDEGDAASAAALMTDVLQFRQQHGDEPMHLAALSWGGKLALALALQQPQRWQSLTLITPGLHALVDLPWHRKIAVAANLAVGGRGHFDVPIQPEMFTSTPENLDFIRHDPWRLHAVTARFLRASLALDRLIARPGSRLHIPVLLVLAQNDRIIDNRAVESLVRRLQPEATVFEFPAADHAVVLDRTDALVDLIAGHLRSADDAREPSRLAAAHAA